MANYPGYRLEHLMKANFSEISFLYRGLPYVAMYKMSKSPMVDRKARKRLNPPKFLDWFYPKS